MKPVDFEILAPGPFLRENITVAYRPGDGMPENGAVRAAIEERWLLHVEEYEKKGMRAFDGALYRLMDFRLSHGHLLLELGDTGFKEYVGTSLKAFWEYFPAPFLASPLAVCITLRTLDGKLVVERRRRVDAYRGRYHVVGGFLERDVDLGPDGLPCPFEGMAREVREEAGIEVNRDELTALALVRNRVIRHPEVCFFAPLQATFQDLGRLQKSTLVDGEIEGFVAVDDTPEDLGRFIAEHHDDFVATGEACLLLYGKDRYGEAWFHNVLRLLTGTSME